LWGADLGEACIIGSVATQHIYGLLFRVLWPLCAGRLSCAGNWPSRKTATRQPRTPAFAWVGSPALLKRMGDNLDWPALSRCRVFSSGGVPADAAEACSNACSNGRRKSSAARKPAASPGARARSLWQPFADVA
jgi:hypothetical protein